MTWGVPLATSLTTKLESTPEERKQPTSTSAIWWAATLSAKVSVMRCSHSSRVGGLVDVVADVVVTAHVQPAGVPGEHMGAGQLVDVLEHRFLVGYILDAQIFGQALLVEFLFEVRVGAESS